jgi:hypothetical protein
VSIWVSLLLDKSLFYRPTYRLLADWAAHGLDLSLGTVSEGLKHLVPLFEPVYRALVRHSQTQALWHADETRWLVFACVEGKGRLSVVSLGLPFRRGGGLRAGRGPVTNVTEEHFGPVEGGGLLVMDRSKAYQAIDQVKSGWIVLDGPGELGLRLGGRDRHAVPPP